MQSSLDFHLCGLCDYINYIKMVFRKMDIFVVLNGWVKLPTSKPDDKVVHKQNNINFRTTESEQHLNHHHGRCWKSCLFSIIIQSINVIYSKSATACEGIRVCVWNNSNMKFPLFVLDTKHAFLFWITVVLVLICIFFLNPNSN